MPVLRYSFSACLIVTESGLFLLAMLNGSCRQTKASFDILAILLRIIMGPQMKRGSLPNFRKCLQHASTSEGNGLSLQGGVLTPAAGLGRGFIDRLIATGITFRILETDKTSSSSKAPGKQT